MSRTVYARNRRGPVLVVQHDGVTHLAVHMVLDLEGVESPYQSACLRLVEGWETVDAPVNCFDCILAGA